MPQMSPMNWLLLFFIFSISLILFNMMNYFLYLSNLPKSTLKYSLKNLNYTLLWKW